MSLLNGPPINAIANKPPLQVWVLGASMGGPKALAEFLSHLYPPLPVTFIIAQHLDSHNLPLFAHSLRRHTTLPITTASHGERISAGRVIVTPVDRHFSICQNHTIQLGDYQQPPRYQPSIDLVMQAVARRYTKHSGTIIFSGMGDDGTLGCRWLAQNHGTVWAQSPTSCIISSMPDSARSSGAVSYSGNPKQLARQLQNRIVRLTMERNQVLASNS
jgi:chemotaxis response regulator CheB